MTDRRIIRDEVDGTTVHRLPTTAEVAEARARAAHPNASATDYFNYVALADAHSTHADFEDRYR